MGRASQPVSVLLVEDEVLISNLVADWLSERGFVWNGKACVRRQTEPKEERPRGERPGITIPFPSGPFPGGPSPGGPGRPGVR